MIDALSDFHAQWWESPELELLEWLPVPNDPAYMATVPGIFAGLQFFNKNGLIV